MITLPYAEEISGPLLLRDVQLHFFQNELMMISFDFQEFRYAMYCRDQGKNLQVEPNHNYEDTLSVSLGLAQLQRHLRDVYQSIADYDLSFHSYVHRYVDPSSKI